MTSIILEKIKKAKTRMTATFNDKFLIYGYYFVPIRMFILISFIFIDNLMPHDKHGSIGTKKCSRMALTDISNGN